ncbi:MULTISPECIES: SDR family NAD(P)-dependent oxidoreductase [unclassified Sphingomonas]|uniref:SDR family NAD(P)-dependent oxidoreductase n=1 Tax=unclassified Sphingomonas TaxID=196159 RepID=UPI0022B56E0C|nr:SDR family oxidoreductase [Sphingomonas sp. NIBR02145]WHU02869.1 SDR family oxidoreductase [Sphingomonas sp. NIBR02145]
MTDSTLGTALITGASTGIGAVYADRLAKRGHDLILVARDTARMQALAERLTAETGHTVEVFPADLTDGDDLDRVAKRLATDEAITLLVNNAGMSLNGGLLDNEGPAIERLIALNITAPALLASAAGKAFKARGRGAIINIASVLAFVPEMYDGTYSGSKAFLLNLSLSLAGQLEPLGVRVQAVLPGATRTEIWERSGKDVDSFPADFVMGVDDLVNAALLGFDRGETVTIPPLADEGLYTAYTEARLAMGPHLSKRDVAPRYREVVEA